MAGALHGAPWLAAVRLLLPAGAAAAAFWLLGAGPLVLPPELLGRASFAATRQVERGWVDAVLPADYLPVLVVEAPCRLESPPPWASAAFSAYRAKDETVLARLAAENPGSWLPPLLWSGILAENGAQARALEVLRRFAGGPAFARLAEPSSRLPVDDQRAMIHFWHRFAYLQQATHSPDGKLFWQSLKNPIGRVKLLVNSGASGPPRNAPSWDEHRLPAPGCPGGELTSFDLYNNLLVAYLEVPGFVETSRRRQQELARAYADPPEENPWQAALEKASGQEPAEREGFVWAVSNTERLLRERRANRLGPPANPLLALNLGLLSSEAAALVPEVREPFWRRIGELADQAAGGAGDPAAAAGVTRLRLLRQSEVGLAGQVPAPPGAGEPVREAVARLAAAVAARRDPATALAMVSGDRELPELGGEAKEWLAALRRDLAAAIAARAPIDAPPAERQAAARQARSVLRGGAAPPELAALEATLPFSSRLAGAAGSLPARSFLALLAGAAVFLLWRFGERELRFRDALWTSFYRRETEGIPRP